MFSGLENFLSAQDEFKVADKDTSKTTPFEETNDSWLDSLDSCDFKTKTKNNGAGKDNDDDDDILSNKESTYVPVKGQKMAAKRLKKIQETMAKGLKDTEKIQKVIDKRKSNTAKAKKNSPSKRAQRATRRGGRNVRRNFVEPDEIDSDSDSDLEESVAVPFFTATHARPARRPQHDPNTIVLDCDDEFVGGPAVNFTRNIAGANAVSVEQSQEMKVNVRINTKIEQFQMNPFQKLSVLISQISQKKNVPSNHIALMLKDKTLSEFETLNSVGYIQGLVINARISNAVGTKKNPSKSTDDGRADKLEIKIQADGRKRPFITYISPTDQLIALAFACAEEFKCDVDKVAIEFDGEFVNFMETAEDLMLEGGEVMDFFQKK